MHIELCTSQLRLPRKRFEISSGVKETAEVFVVEVKHGSMSGLGAGTPATSIGDSVSDCRKGLSLANGLQIDPLTYFDEEDDLEIRDVSPAAAAAVDIAMWDLYSKSNGMSLAAMIGEQVKDVQTDATIDIVPPEEAEMTAKGLAGQGFSMIKVKVGKSLEEDLERVSAVRKGAGPETRLIVDANGGFDKEKALAFWEKASKFDIEFFEQPVPQDRIEELAELKGQGIKICVDESVLNEELLIQLVEKEAADVINIKLMKCGGISSAIEMAGIARDSELEIMVGCMGDIGVSIAAAAHLACGIGAEYADLDSHLNIVQVCDGPSVENGHLILKEIPGHGVRLIEGWKKYRASD